MNSNIALAGGTSHCSGKSTDVRATGAELYLLPVTSRMPLKFGPETLTTVTCARVRVTVRGRPEPRTRSPNRIVFIFIHTCDDWFYPHGQSVAVLVLDSNEERTTREAYVLRCFIFKKMRSSRLSSRLLKFLANHFDRVHTHDYCLVERA